MCFSTSDLDALLGSILSVWFLLHLVSPFSFPIPAGRPTVLAPDHFSLATSPGAEKRAVEGNMHLKAQTRRDTEFIGTVTRGGLLE